MKKFLFVILCLALGFGAGFGYRTAKDRLRQDRRDRKYRIARKTHPIFGNKPFVIITMSYNNAPYVAKNLVSTLEQDYDNFRILYIDDASTDGTGDQVKVFLDQYDTEKRVTLIQNESNRGAMENLYRAVHSCSSEEIVVIVDGDDFLAHPHVLSELNAYYANPDVWMTYGNFAEYPSYAMGSERKFADARPLNLKILEQRGVRKHAFVTTHLRTFYSGLFHRIKLQDFLMDGQFLPVACDVASMLPMVELAGEHVYFVQDILYLYNTGNPNCDFKKAPEEQLAMEERIRNLSPYTFLGDHPSHSYIDQDEHVDLAVFSYNRPLQLYAFLESSEKYIQGIYRTFVIYHAENEYYEKGFQKVKEAFPGVMFFKQSESSPNEDLAPTLCQVVFNRDMSTTRYLMFAVDDSVVKDTINLKDAVSHMKQTGAYGFYFRLGRRVDHCYKGDFHQGIPSSHKLGKGLYAWQFSSGQGDWQCPNTADMALFKKEDIYPDFLCMKFHNSSILEALWSGHADLSKVGLYYEESKVVNIPLNITWENEWINESRNEISKMELLQLFEEGMKMDISPLHKIDNHSAHIEYQPRFIER